MNVPNTQSGTTPATSLLLPARKGGHAATQTAPDGHASARPSTKGEAEVTPPDFATLLAALQPKTAPEAAQVESAIAKSGTTPKADGQARPDKQVATEGGAQVEKNETTARETGAEGAAPIPALRGEPAPSQPFIRAHGHSAPATTDKTIPSARPQASEIPNDPSTGASVQADADLPRANLPEGSTDGLPAAAQTRLTAGEPVPKKETVKHAIAENVTLAKMQRNTPPSLTDTSIDRAQSHLSSRRSDPKQGLNALPQHPVPPQRVAGIASTPAPEAQPNSATPRSGTSVLLKAQRSTNDMTSRSDPTLTRLQPTPIQQQPQAARQQPDAVQQQPAERPILEQPLPLMAPEPSATAQQSSTARLQMPAATQEQPFPAPANVTKGLPANQKVGHTGKDTIISKEQPQQDFKPVASTSDNSLVRIPTPLPQAASIAPQVVQTTTPVSPAQTAQTASIVPPDTPDPKTATPPPHSAAAAVPPPVQLTVGGIAPRTTPASAAAVRAETVPRTEQALFHAPATHNTFAAPPRTSSVTQPFSLITAPAGGITDSDPLKPLSAFGEAAEPTVWDPARAPAPVHTSAAIARADIAPHIARQLVEVIAQAQHKPVEIALSPQELGRVRMSISSDDGAITVNILAERPETLDLMRRHIDQLGQSFRTMGYDQITFAFGGGATDDSSGGEASADESNGEATAEQTQPANAPDTSNTITLTTASDGGIDIRL